MSNKGWIGVDFDGTLATYEWGQFPVLGEPIPRMVNRVKKWLAEGLDVRIVTARVADSKDDGGEPTTYSPPAIQRANIELWCLHHLGQVLEVTSSKDGGMKELWDDRAIRVERNTGKIAKTLPRRGSKNR